ncbi:MAG TPA: hypothetical protein RMH85_10675 [Polyangiaceae bacterium LLY-WYZ-15_(1-7)]|nr:hypothetical protein [Myxococcales bacterium]MAT25460.1 hypothetical protein [Sandaracinus sp.]HJK91397.1 hypothetical protein [Polyangiaceae bacterium LLY-WYZ-15_(1-7)]MBJ73933.1 hypothetical protein [Sandaracinus sp.]HJL00692.1 hypothetical protein [Polyangiaceae bacterium LLY-WYZ-15_(1-7)]
MRRRLAPPFAPALLLLLLLAGCASHRGGRLARKLDALGEALGLGAALCGGGLALLLLGGGVATLVWNRRRPSARSRRWGLVLGAANLLLALLAGASFASDPPRERSVERVASGEVEEVGDATGGPVHEVPVLQRQEVAGPVKLGAFAGLLAFTVAWGALGVGGVYAARASRDRAAP